MMQQPIPNSAPAQSAQPQPVQQQPAQQQPQPQSTQPVQQQSAQSQPVQQQPAQPWPYAQPVPAQPYYVVPQKPFLADSKEWLLLFLSLALGILLREWIFLPDGVGFSAVLFVLAFYGAVFSYGSGVPEFQPKRGLGWGIPVVLGLACCVLYSNPLLSICNVLFLYLTVGFHVWTMFGQRGKEVFDDLAFSSICAPFAKIDAPFRTLAQGGRLNKKSGRTGKIILGLVISVPVALVVVLLLVSADEAFESVLKNIYVDFSRLFGRAALDVLIGLFFSIFVFSWLYSARRREKKADAPKKQMPKVFDSTVVATVIFVVCAIYIVFLAVQFRYLFSAVWGLLPTDYIYSSYARRGFFEMLVVAGINLLILIFALCSRERDQLLPKLASCLLSVLTVVLALSALSKMVMYVNVYGMTPLRVYTSWFLLAEIAVFVLLTVGILCKRFPTAKALFIGGIALFLALNFVSVDGMIARYNTERYLRSPETTDMDVALFEHLGYESVPYLVELCRSSPDADTVLDAKFLLSVKYDNLQQMDWRAKNIAVLRVEKQLQQMRSETGRVPSPSLSYSTPGYTYSYSEG